MVDIGVLRLLLADCDAGVTVSGVTGHLKEAQRRISYVYVGTAPCLCLGEIHIEHWKINSITVQEPCPASTTIIRKQSPKSPSPNTTTVHQP
jgi:hypothetical protein